MSGSKILDYSEVHSIQQKHEIEISADTILQKGSAPIRIAYGVLAELSKHCSKNFYVLYDALEKAHDNEKAKKYRKTLKLEYEKYLSIKNNGSFEINNNEHLFLAQNCLTTVKSSGPSRGVIVVFTTIFNNFYMTKVIMAQILHQAGFDLIFVNDSTTSYYLSGINSAINNWNSLIGAISVEVEKLGANKLIITGFSSGGYAALMASLLLRPDDFHIFSGIVDFSYDNISMHPRVAGAKIKDQVPAELMRDLSVDLNSSNLSGTFYAGSLDEQDVYDLKKIETSNSIKVKTIKNVGHICFRNMLLDDSFAGLFQDV